MKKLLTTLAVVFLCAKMHPQAIVSPQINVSGNVGCVGFPCLNSGNLNFAADANQTMTALQTSANGGIKITNSVALTATRTLTVPSGNFQFMDIENATTGGQSVMICSASGGTCVTIPSATTAVGVWFDGTNFVTGSTGGGGSMVYPGVGIGNSTGSAWATSYGPGNQIPASFVSTLNQSTTGNAATATALATTPSQCTGAQYAQGVTAAGNANCATPTGSGIPTTPTNALVKINGSAGAASSVTDNGTTVSTTEGFSAAAGITAGPDGTHAGIMALYGNTANPTIPANEFGWLGFNTTSATSYFLQPGTTAPVGPSVMEAATPSGNVSQVTYSSTLGTINGVSFPVNGSITVPSYCAGYTCTNQNQNNPNVTVGTLTTTASITSSSLTIPTTSTTGFPAVGCGWMNTGVEYFCWDSITSSSLVLTSTSERGVNGSTASSHASGSLIVVATFTLAPSPTSVPSYAVAANGLSSFSGHVNTALTFPTQFYGATYFPSLLAAEGGILINTGIQFASSGPIFNGVSANVTGNEFVTCPTGGTGTQVCDASGAWIGSSGGITALTGDVTASGTGSVAATVKGINGTLLSGLATGPLCNTNSTGVPTNCTAAQTAAYAKNVIYATAGNSTLGVAACTLNSNTSTGGGTSADACIQAGIDALGTAGGGTYYWNGAALLTCANFGTTNAVDGNVQTTAIQTHSNVKIDATGGGAFMQAAANCAMLGNNITGNPAATFQTNMTVTGGIWNENGTNQSKYEQGNTSNLFNLAVWFGGFSGVTINNMTVRNAATYAFMFSNGNTFTVQNSASTHDTLCTTTCNNDGIHLWGTLTGGYITNFTNTNGDDDVIAVNTDEGVSGYNSGLSANPNRQPNSGGAISNILIDTVNIINSHQPFRWFGTTTANGVATVSNITVRNFTGSPTTAAMLQGGITAASNISIQDWNLTGGNNALALPGATTSESTTQNNNASTGGALQQQINGTLTVGNYVYNAVGYSTTQQVQYGWFHTGASTGFGFINGNSNPLLLWGTYVGTIEPLAIQNNMAGTSNGFSCGTGIQLCVEPSSNTAAPFEVNTSGGIVSSTRTGTFVCTSGGVITVANTNAITTSSIIITTNTPGGTQTFAPNKTGGTSGTNFIVTCATGDTSTYNYDILN